MKDAKRIAEKKNEVTKINMVIDSGFLGLCYNFIIKYFINNYG